MSDDSLIAALNDIKAERIAHRYFARIEQNAHKLHEIERDIVAGLKARPILTWCTGCHRLLDAIYAKATKEEEEADV